jgi:integrase
MDHARRQGERTMGMLCKRGNTWWIKYYRNGKPYRESTGSDKKMIARKLLEQREGDIAQGKIPGIHFERVKFDELAEDFLADYRVNAKKSLERAQISVRHLAAFFRGVRITDISTARIRNYIEDRMGSGASNATINRELAALKRMLSLGAKCTPPKVDRIPHISMLKENNVRKGFFEYEEFLALRGALPEYLRGPVTFAFKTGWRRSEIVDLTWSQVDLQRGIVRLEPGMAKNDLARTIYLDAELKGIFQHQWERRKHSVKLVPYVFLNESSTDKIKDFRGAWDTACRSAGFGKRLFHDFRRTAIRDMVRAGIPERVAMMISGHQTRSVFERYNIVSDEDLKLAAIKRETYHNKPTGTISGTITPLRKKKGLREKPLSP